jgi:protein gp37
MSAVTSIEWTDRTWNPLRGCSRISPGCVNCYAEVIAARFSGPGQPFEGFADRKKAGSKWTGKVELVPAALDEPLGWRKPARVFVNSMSDLFHEALPIEAIARVFAVMYLAPQHTFQVLTKRAARMREVLTSPLFYGLVLSAATEIRRTRPDLLRVAISDPSKFPHRNVWLGVSIESQPYARRVLDLIETPAAVRFLSCEPLIAPLDLTRITVVEPDPPNGPGAYLNALTGHVAGPDDILPNRIDWVIVGGESGPGARPCDVAWIRSIVEQCGAANVPCFVKQLGAVPSMAETTWRANRGLRLLSAANKDRVPEGAVPLKLFDKKGGDVDEWPSDLRVRQFPEVRHA